jgi:hypothetical protein
VPTLTNLALAEHMAAGGVEFHLATIELSHPAIAETIRIVSNSDEDMMLPIEGGQTVLFKACRCEITFGGHDEDGPTDPKIRIDNVSGLLFEPLEAAQGTNQAMSVTLRTYLLDTASFTADLEDSVPGYKLKIVNLTADTSEGALMLEDGRTRNFPAGAKAFFDIFNYPGLFTT